VFILKIFSKKWILFTIFIGLSMALFVRLGFWQLDRLEQKRTYNATLAARWQQDPFNLSREQLPADMSELEYRRVTAEGYFDYENQLILKSQVYRDAVGVALLTPFVMDGNRAVLVARGWVPLDRSNPQFWPEMEEPADAPLIGLIRPSETLPNGAQSTPPASAQTEWFRIDIPAIQAQMPYALEPVWIQQLPEAARPVDQLPAREEPMVLDESTHMGYAVQWFSFAVIAGFGYIMFVRFRERQSALALHNPTSTSDGADAEDGKSGSQALPTSNAELLDANEERQAAAADEKKAVAV
jgi:surfeit locus 1 family protein